MSQQLDRQNSLEWSHFLWLQTGFLGDIILTTAALDWVRRALPHVRQTVITTPLGKKALQDHPAVDEILVFDKRQQSLWKAVRELKTATSGLDRKKTVFLQAHRSARSSLLARALGFYTIGYEEANLAFLADKRVPRVAVLHETQRILMLLEGLGLARWKYRTAGPYLPAHPASVLGQEIKDWTGEDPLLAIAPGSVWGTKRWPMENFRELASCILRESNAKLLVMGTADEKEATDCVAEIADGFPNRLKNVAGKTQLDDLRAIYPQLKLLVCNDSSPLHYASAFGVPSIAIFGATVPGLGFGPLAPGSQVIEKLLLCRPCSDHGPQTCPLTHFACMRQISHKQVLPAVWKILGLKLSE